MERVNGIGGVFFRTREPERLTQWYAEHLGVDGPPPSYDDAPWQQEAGPTVFAPFPSDSEHFGNDAQQWAINFRGRDLDAMVSQLRDAGLTATSTKRSNPTAGSPISSIPRATRFSCGSPRYEPGGT